MREQNGYASSTNLLIGANTSKDGVGDFEEVLNLFNNSAVNAVGGDTDEIINLKNRGLEVRKLLEQRPSREYSEITLMIIP